MAGERSAELGVCLLPLQRRTLRAGHVPHLQFLRQFLGLGPLVDGRQEFIQAVGTPEEPEAVLLVARSSRSASLPLLLPAFPA